MKISRQMRSTLQYLGGIVVCFMSGSTVRLALGVHATGYGHFLFLFASACEFALGMTMLLTHER